MEDENKEKLRLILNTVFKDCHKRSYRAGWWHGLTDNIPLKASENSDPRYAELLNYVVATKFALIHSEISEAMEGHRRGLLDDHLTNRPAIECELADAIIRIGDLAAALNLDVGGAIIEKLDYNSKRADHKPAERAKPRGKLY